MATDRGSIRFMVEEFWRNFLTTAQSAPHSSRQMLDEFDANIDLLASQMPSEEAHSFSHMVEEERDLLFQEYQRSPDALKVRLGVLPPAPMSARSIAAHDHQAIIRAVQNDYADLQLIARGSGSFREKSEMVDRELDIRVRSYTVGMTMLDQAEFSRVYNQEYNRMVMARLSERKGQSGCAVVMVAGVGLMVLGVGYSYILV